MAAGPSYHSFGALPTMASGFVGRRAEIARASELLGGKRLVTITGGSGIGKTRLAVQVAAEIAGWYSHGVHLVELSGVRDPGLLGCAVAAGLAVSGTDGRPPREAVADHLRDRTLLLILDGCEHLAEACATLAGSVQREAPGVTILATSEKPLRVDGEAVMLLPPLRVPASDSASGAQPIGDLEAVELFASRAADAVPGFVVTSENRAAITALCRRLDGIPLAIELVTGLLRELSLQEIAGQLDGRLRTVTHGTAAGPDRRQTLRAVMEWSYTLCSQTEQLVWARLSAFAGSFTVAAAREVCAGGPLRSDDIDAALAGLAGQRVLIPDASGGSGRMLDAVREFGADRLRLDGGNAQTVVRSRFIARYLAMAERFEREPTNDPPAQYRALRQEHANLRAAFDYALGMPGNEGAAISMATSLFRYWRVSGQLPEGEYWLTRALARCPRRSVVRARALSVRGHLRVLLGDVGGGLADAEDAVALGQQFGDMASCWRGYLAMQRAFTLGGNLPGAQEAGRLAASCLSNMGDAQLIAMGLADSGAQLGDADDAVGTAAIG